MITPSYLKKIVSGGESSELEFKKKVNHPDKIVREMVAFANAKGGVLLIGVDDDKRIIGVKDPQEEMEVLNKSVHDLVKPEIRYEMELVPISPKRKVIYYRIKESKNKPHFVNPSPGARKGVAYFRYKDKSIQASLELLNVIRKKKRFKKGYLLNYGSTEEGILKLIDEKGPMTIPEIHDLLTVDKNVLSRSLVNLVIANVVEMQPRDGEDLYCLKQQ